MKKQMVGNVPGNVLGMLADLAHKLQCGSRTPEELAKFLKGENPFEEPDYITDWQNFYQEIFDMKVDFSKLRIPEKRNGFNRLIIVAKGMTSQKLFDKCKELFPLWKLAAGNLDEARDPEKLERSPEKKSYAIWLRDRVEADRELKNLSANYLQQKSIPTITLEERLLFELKYFKETKKHLDIHNITLCSGSRCFVDGVPFVYWHSYDGEFYVGWGNSFVASSDLRSREVVS